MHLQRFDAIDALRGVALVWMIVFHFCFDLNYFGYLRGDFHNDSLWTWQRSCILSLFLFCAGLGQAVALQQAQTWARFWRRWGQIALCALLVSIGSWIVFPRSFIHFGVLHGIAVMLILVRVTAPWSKWFWLLGALAIAAKFAAAAVLADTALATKLNGSALNWLGLITKKPITEDYVPVFPWIGVVWWGVAAGQLLIARESSLLAWTPGRAGRQLAGLGRWSLTVYMVHQPVLLGVLGLIGTARP